MGRRSINTTKSGKFMNPTDQARKEARKRELKRNKRQRNIVRANVLKGKDPHQILEEMELVDKMEFDPTQPPRLNERVLKEKHKKLREMYDRVIHLYEKEDAEYAMELRRMLGAYDKKRQLMQVYYDQVKNAERVKLEQIPLPEAPGIQAIASMIPLPGDIPLPMNFSHGRMGPALHGILKKSSTLPPSHVGSRLPSTALQSRKRKPVGPPPGPPPDLSDSDSDSEQPAKPADDESMEYNPEDNIADLIESKKKNLEPDSSEESSEDSEDEEERNADINAPPAKQRRIRFVDDGTRQDNEEEKDTRLKFKPSAAALQAKMRSVSGQQVHADKLSGDQSEQSKDENRKKRKRNHDDDDRQDDGDDDSSSSSDDSSGDEPSDDDDLDVLEKLSKEEKAAKRRALKEKQSAAGVKSGGLAPIGLPPGPPPGLPPMMYRQQGPPGAPPGLPPRMLPPGPPRGRPPMMPLGGPGMPPPMRLPPGPPGMPPPHLLHPPNIPPPSMLNSQSSFNVAPPPRMGGMPPLNLPNVLSAPPNIMRMPGPGPMPYDGFTEKKSATIEAKAQIKHVIGDSTRFLPTALRVKREMKDSKGQVIKPAVTTSGGTGSAVKAEEKNKPTSAATVQTKDDAYDSFMREMEGLL